MSKKVKKAEVAVLKPQAVKLAVVEKIIKLDLACGQSPREGYEGVDISPCKEVKHVQNLWNFPWPWQTSTVESLHCSHHIEHIPMVYVRKDGKTYCDVPDEPGCRDLFAAFFDECWRILKPGGEITVICPCARSNRAFQDFTHRRFIVGESFLYLNKLWRDQNKLDHYGISCNFDIRVDPIIPNDLAALHPEAQARRFNESWNAVLDWQATLKACK